MRFVKTCGKRTLSAKRQAEKSLSRTKAEGPPADPQTRRWLEVHKLTRPTPGKS